MKEDKDILKRLNFSDLEKIYDLTTEAKTEEIKKKLDKKTKNYE